MKKGHRMMDGYVTIADFGEWSIVEEYGSERTIQESERILRYCNERERRNRKIEAKRKLNRISPLHFLEQFL